MNNSAEHILVWILIVLAIALLWLVLWGIGFLFSTGKNLRARRKEIEEWKNKADKYYSDLDGGFKELKNSLFPFFDKDDIKRESLLRWAKAKWPVVCRHDDKESILRIIPAMNYVSFPAIVNAFPELFRADYIEEKIYQLDNIDSDYVISSDRQNAAIAEYNSFCSHLPAKIAAKVLSQPQQMEPRKRWPDEAIPSLLTQPPIPIEKGRKWADQAAVD